MLWHTKRVLCLLLPPPCQVVDERIEEVPEGKSDDD